jgi:hypothetical protein
LVEHATENCGVASPILALGTRPEGQATCGRGSVVERLLAKEKVVGSNPIARSDACGLQIDDCRLSISNPQSILSKSMASWPSGKARVCKTLIMGSNPIDASLYDKTSLQGLVLIQNVFVLTR